MPVNFQVLRRTFATNAQGHGNAKDVQTHLRHSDIATTLGVYTQPIDANVRRLVNAVTADVMTSEPEPDSEKTPGQLNTIEHTILNPAALSCWIIGAGDGDRTRDIQLGKLAFYR